MGGGLLLKNGNSNSIKKLSQCVSNISIFIHNLSVTIPLVYMTQVNKSQNIQSKLSTVVLQSQSVYNQTFLYI